ncbi:glycosyltransferase family 4 protein [Microbulbifer pacificus]|uniref:Glycosyltransferase family 4 protein n=1 Tax=Microbulbifer pacificus TaxID=407164 RepID=A0AAU0MX86_9GAMM|nr:glycosyltransferase family 4 protein [Microbulbifer pacificus]WOX04481.1 glycosyltransferase family 4 protein [Microbulbifer pacificus]
MILIATQNFPPDRGGIEILMGGLAEALAAAGHEVRVLADASHVAEAARARPFQLQRYGGMKPLRRWRKARALRQAVRAGAVEGVFADSWKSAELLGDLGVPLAVLAHGMEFPEWQSPRKAERIHRALFLADSVIANSRYTAEQVQPYLQGGTRLTVINPPIWPQPTATAQSLARLRARIGGGDPVLATLARLEPRKGVDMVIRALPQIRARHPQVVYLIAGLGDDQPRLKRLAEELQVAECVHFLGPMDEGDKAALYEVADLFAMPARREGNSVEGFGIVYREAQWYGVPVLAGRDGGAVDAVAGGELGALCNGADAGDVCAQLLRLLDDDAGRRALAEKGMAVARGPAQWAQSVDAFLAELRRSC